MAQEVDPKADPLGPDNVLVYAAGILAGTSVPNSGRLSVGAKSPLTGGIKEANAGGSAARKMAQLDLRGIKVTGRADSLSLLEVTADGGTLVAAAELKGLGTRETVQRLRERYGDGVSIICAGPAGELQLKAASVTVTSPDFRPRAAARGGLGAVMGAKNLKAIVIDDAGGQRREARRPGRHEGRGLELLEGHPLAPGGGGAGGVWARPSSWMSPTPWAAWSPGTSRPVSSRAQTRSTVRASSS